MSALDFRFPRRLRTAPGSVRAALPGWVLRRRVLIPLALLIALAAAGSVAYARRGGSGVQYRTVTASLGTVTQSMSLSGNLAAVGETDLGFGASGRVQMVNVQPGQAVKVGDVLSALDTSGLQGALTQARANLESAGAKLSQDQTGVTPQSLAQAVAAVNTAQVNLRNAQTSRSDTANVNQESIVQGQNAVTAAQNSVNSDLTMVSSDGSSGRLATDQQTLARDQGALDSAQNSLVATEIKSRQSDDLATGAVNSAQVALNNAQQSYLALRQGSTPQQLEMDRSQIQIAQVSVDSAQRSLDQATIISPVEGIAGQVNITVGQSESGSSSSSSSGSSAAGGAASSSASGGSTSATGASTGASTGGAAPAGGGAASTSLSSASSSGAAISILTPGLFQVTATVSDAQVGQTALGQRARILPAGATEALTGRVSQISPVATVTSGVATFAVTVTVDGTNPGLRAGMSAAITLILNQAVHVLTVPTGAVHTTGGGTSVDVLAGGQPQTRPVTVGASDALRTEILSGVNEGDTIVVATVSSSVPSPSAAGGGAAGGGIFGAGGAGGGARPGGAGGRGGGGGG